MPPVRFAGLCDLAREVAATRALAYRDRLSEQDEPEDPGGEPGDLLAWTDFHERIDSLPDEEREVFDLIFYQRLMQAEAAAFLKISFRTVKRRWQRARVLLRDAMRGEGPGEP